MTTSVDQQAWLFTFAEPKLVEFANMIAEEIPEQPVIFRTPVNVSLSDVVSLDNKAVMNVGISPIGTNKLEFRGNYQQKPLQPDFLDISTPKNIIGLISQSFELLGGFREKVVSTFDPPF
ncbi:MAG: hypothetical protein V7749_12075 [Cocleimonas sp.]